MKTAPHPGDYLLERSCLSARKRSPPEMDFSAMTMRDLPLRLTIFLAAHVALIGMALFLGSEF